MLCSCHPLGHADVVITPSFVPTTVSLGNARVFQHRRKRNLSADVGAKSEEVYQPKEVAKRFILSSLHRLWSLYHVVKPEYEKRIASAGYQNTFVSQYHSQRPQLLLPRYTVHHFRRSEQKRPLADGFAYELPSPAPQLIRWSGRPAADQ